MNDSARRMLFSGLSFWLVVAGICLYSIYPLKEKLRYGIDLVGGVYLTLEVQTEKAVESELLGIMQGISRKLKKVKKPVPTTKAIEKNKIVLTFEDMQAAQTAAVHLRGERDMNVSVSEKQVYLQFDEKKEKRIKANAVETNKEVFRRRLDKLSVAEINIAVEGERNIIIELPGLADPDQARMMIGKPAVLEFKLVDKMGRTEEDILYEYDGIVPDDMEVVPGKPDDSGSRNYYLVPRYTDITGKLLRDASSGIVQAMKIKHVVHFRFSAEGGEKFHELTSRNVGQRLAIILDNEVIMAPTINSADMWTDGVIEGVSSQEAKDLAMLLKSGALVAPITIEGQQEIGPTLGADSIKQGLMSCLVGLGLLLAFSVFYYSLSGLLAFLALMFNLCLVLFGLSVLGAVLTLPGIAGMVLTIGMAIDASILIYERIKDGLAAGLSIKKAVDTGFSTAMVVILDANITTFIVGIVLYWFGTGPLQGFAVTMMLGIVSTLITGLFFLRSLFNFILNNFRVQKLSI